VPLTSYPGVAFGPSISPDGKQLAFVWDANTGNYDLYLKLIGVGDPIRVTTSPGQDLHPAWSPNGQYLAFLRSLPEKKEIMIVPALAGTERELTDVYAMPGTWTAEPTEAEKRRGPVWSSDGQFLAVTDGDKEVSGGKYGEGVFLVKVEDGSKRRLTYPPPPDNDSLPAFSPDGKFLAFVRYITNSVTDLFVIPLRGGPVRRLTSDRRQIQGISWTPDSRSIVFSSNRGGAFCLWRVKLSGSRPQLIAAGAGNATDPFVAKDGKRIAYTDTLENTNIWRIPNPGLNGSQANPEPFIASSRRNDSAQYSPSGEKIAFMSDRSGSWQIWLCDRNGKNPVQLTALGGSVTGSPRWSPDGQWLAFDSREEGHSAIYLIRRTGGEPKRLEVNSYEESMPTWSRDGKWLYFTSNRGGPTQLWKRPVASGPARCVTAAVAYDAMESPDGRWVYYLGKRPGIWKAPIAGGQGEAVPELSEIHPSRYWALTERGIYFVTQESAPRTIRFFSFSNRQIETRGTIQRNLVAGTPSLAVSPDEQWILYAQKDQRSSDIMMLENF
jgi:Tol biopolymer transport system component